MSGGTTDNIFFCRRNGKYSEGDIIAPYAATRSSALQRAVWRQKYSLYLEITFIDKCQGYSTRFLSIASQRQIVFGYQRHLPYVSLTIGITYYVETEWQN
jgi:hypothetical protein